MKFDKTERLALALLIALIVLCCLPGCATGSDGGLFREEVTERTIETPARTNYAPSGDIVITPAMIRKIFETNYTVKPSVQQSIDAAQAANSMLNPTPSAPLIHMGLGALSGILGIVAAWKTKKAKQNATVSDLLIQGIEMANKPEVKSAIQTLSRKKGLQDLVHKQVTKLTKDK